MGADKVVVGNASTPCTDLLYKGGITVNQLYDFIKSAKVG